jgi:hypothetical protein
MSDRLEECLTIDIKNAYTISEAITVTQDIKNHILNARHTYRTITDTTVIIKTERKGRYLNTLGKYHIYEICKFNLHMNDTNIDIHNPIFKTLHRIYTK